MTILTTNPKTHKTNYTLHYFAHLCKNENYSNNSAEPFHFTSQVGKCIMTILTMTSIHVINSSLARGYPAPDDVCTVHIGY